MCSQFSCDEYFFMKYSELVRLEQAGYVKGVRNILAREPIHEIYCRDIEGSSSKYTCNYQIVGGGPLVDGDYIQLASADEDNSSKGGQFFRNPLAFTVFHICLPEHNKDAADSDFDKGFDLISKILFKHKVCVFEVIKSGVKISETEQHFKHGKDIRILPGKSPHISIDKWHVIFTEITQALTSASISPGFKPYIRPANFADLERGLEILKNHARAQDQYWESIGHPLPRPMIYSPQLFDMDEELEWLKYGDKEIPGTNFITYHVSRGTDFIGKAISEERFTPIIVDGEQCPNPSYTAPPSGRSFASMDAVILRDRADAAALDEVDLDFDEFDSDSDSDEALNLGH